MLDLNFNLFPSHKSNPSALPIIGPGTEIEVETLCYGKQIGTIQFISDSPYCNEPGLQRAYVIGNGWTDYVLLEEIAPDAPDFELEDDPEYMQYLFDLEQAERDQELEDEQLDEDSYEPPSFLWNGRRFPSPYTY